jgi:membrane protein implicated in regulation of membrane protease activity
MFRKYSRDSTNNGMGRGEAVLEVYWGCFIIGILLCLIAAIFGDIIGGAVDGMLDFLSLEASQIFNPMTAIGGIAAFGGIGIILTEYTSYGPLAVFAMSFCLSLLISAAVYFLYVRPMNNSENSIGYSIMDLEGKIGEVSIPIPSKGFGEVMLKVGPSHVNEIAASFEHQEIPAGSRVVVVEVKERTLYVSLLDS